MGRFLALLSRAPSPPPRRLLLPTRWLGILLALVVAPLLAWVGYPGGRARRRGIVSALLILAGVVLGQAAPVGALGSAQLTWVMLAPAASPLARDSAAMAYDPATNQVVLFGGSGASGALGDTWTWNGTNWTQASTTGPSARVGAVMAYDPATSQLVLFGGLAPGHGLLADTWVWNGTAWSQRPVSTSPPIRVYAALAYDPVSRQLILFGGAGQSGYVNDTWGWNGSAWAQLSPATAPSPREQVVLADDPATNQLVLFGGYSPAQGGNQADTWLWSGTNWVPLSPALSPPKRAEAVMAYDPGLGQLVLFGGCCNADGFPIGDTWMWNGTAWSQASPTAGPANLQLATLAYDTAAGQLLLFGGNVYNPTTGGGDVSDTWVFRASPAITSATSTSFAVGAAGTFTVTATGDPAPALAETGALPGGVSFVDHHNGTATLAGTPASGTGGTYPLTITASNGVSPNATQSFTLTVASSAAPPTITSASSANFVVDVASSFTVAATGEPTPSLTETGALPAGVTFRDNGNGTATLAGTPASGTGGTYPLTITATNSLGSFHQSFTLTVGRPPRIYLPIIMQGGKV